MNIDEAKAILRIHRRGPDQSHDREVADALKLAEENAELARWWDAESAFDEKVAEKLAGVPPPGGLRDQILLGAGPSNEAQKKALSGRRGLPAAAAALLILAAIAALLVNRNPRPRLANWQSGSLAVLAQVLAGADQLDIESPRSTELRAWLTKAQAPSPTVLPGDFEKLDSLGCKTVRIGNAKISIICFHIDQTRLAHLVTVEESSLERPPPESRPEYVRKGEWVTASWSSRGQSYMLAMKGSEDELRGLLSPTA